MNVLEWIWSPHTGQRYWNGLVVSALAQGGVWLHIWLVCPVLVLSEVFKQDLFLLLHLCKVPTLKTYLLCPSPLVISQISWLSVNQTSKQQTFVVLQVLYPEVRNQHHCAESKCKPIHCFYQRPASQASLGSGLNPHVATSRCITTFSCLFKRHLSLNSRPRVNNPGYFILSHFCKDPICYLRSHLKRNRLGPVEASSQLYVPTPLELFS